MIIIEAEVILLKKSSLYLHVEMAVWYRFPEEHIQETVIISKDWTPR